MNDSDSARFLDELAREAASQDARLRREEDEDRALLAREVEALRREADLFVAMREALASPDPSALQRFVDRLRREDSPAARLLLDSLRPGEILEDDDV